MLQGVAGCCRVCRGFEKILWWMENGGWGGRRLDSGRGVRGERTRAGVASVDGAWEYFSTFVRVWDSQIVDSR